MWALQFDYKTSKRGRRDHCNWLSSRQTRILRAESRRIYTNQRGVVRSVGRCRIIDPLPTWLSGNSLVSISVVTLCLARSVPGWATIFGRVNHLGTERGTHVYSAWAFPPWVGTKTYPAKAGEVNRQIAWYTSPYLWSSIVGWCLAEGLVNGDQRRRTGSGNALEACSRRCAIQIRVYFMLLYYLL